MKKLEEIDEPQELNIISHEMSMKIRQARTNKNLTQKQLAKMCNLHISIIQNYENEKAIINSHLATIKHVLNIK